ncbi:MAG: hypothetical protein IAF58_05715 [Leptolyngbya sp.]|nr:hypothetical protein [Candidatus Melainabacteria bacterium]
MQLTAEVKDDNYAEMPRQQEAIYAKSTDTFLRADASSGRHYYDLNAASKTYSGPWLFGRQHIEVSVNGMKGQWVQWCPVPADIRDGVLLRGNVIYQNQNGTYHMSSDVYEGIIETHGGREFVGKTQHTFVANNLPGGKMQVVSNIRIKLDERLAYNPMLPRSQPSTASSGGYQNAQTFEPAVASYSNSYASPASYNQSSYQQPAWGSSSNQIIAQPQGNPVEAQYSTPPASYNAGSYSQYGGRDNHTYKNDPDGGF